MRMVGSVLTIAAAAGVAACVSEEVAYDLLQYGNYESFCFADAPKHLSGVNWSKARVLNIDIRDGQFSSYGIYLNVGEPTILKFNNRDDTSRNFNADEFMRAVALEYVSTGGHGLTRPCIKGFGIGPGHSAEMRLVPVKAGTYYPEDSLAWYVGPTELFSRGGFGIITVSR